MAGTLVCGEENFTKENTLFVLRNEQEWKNLGVKKQCVCVCVRESQSCPTLRDSMDCSPPGSSVYAILQARILEWVSIPFSRGIFPDLRSNQGLLTLQADSSLSEPLEKPLVLY